MRRTVSTMMAAAVFCLTPPARAESAEEASVKAAQAAATAWLALVDRGDYAASWRQASTLFREQVTEEKWRASLASARGPFGKMVSRKLSSARYTTTLPGAPDGEYVIIRYATSFENKKEGIETVTPVKDRDGAWRVSGYFLR